MRAMESPQVKRQLVDLTPNKKPFKDSSLGSTHVFHVWERPSVCSLVHRSLKLECHRQHRRHLFSLSFSSELQDENHILLRTVCSVFGGLGRTLSQGPLSQNF